MQITVIVEIPKGSRNKYEMDHASGAVWLDRMLFTSTMFPADYGFVPHSLAGDGDPLDALVLLDEPTFPGCHIHARPVGVFWMRDQAGPDAKVLCVPSTDPRWSHITELEHVQSHTLEEMAHFFEVYKALEPGKFTETSHWGGRIEAEATVAEALAAHRG